MIREVARTRSARGSGAVSTHSHRNGAKVGSDKPRVIVEDKTRAYLLGREVCQGYGTHTWSLESQRRSAKERSELFTVGQSFVVPEPKHSSSDQVPCSSSSAKVIEAGLLDRTTVAISKISRRKVPDGSGISKIQMGSGTSGTNLGAFPRWTRATKDMINHSSRRL